MTVKDWRSEQEGGIIGELRWSAAPGASFLLRMARDGRLVEWRAIADEGRSLAARQLRAAPIGAMERALRREVGGFAEAANELARVVRRLEDRWPDDLPDIGKVGDEFSELSASLADFSERPRTGPAGRSDLSYATLSALYVQLVDEGEPRPIRTVADRLGLAEKTVQNHLYKARERGLLTSLGRGRAGGRLTDKGKELLDGHRQAP